jgi:hypothetical protein
MRTLAVDAQTAEVMSGLAARGVETLLLKGLVVARRLYAADEPRFYGDTDLLVAPDALADAHRTLGELGYEPWVGDRSAELIGHHGTHWRRPGSLLEVDLHHTLTGVRADPQALWDALREHTTSLEVHGTPVRVPADAALALHLALHAAQHGVARETPWHDLRRGIEQLDRAAWHAAAALAARVDAVDAFGVGLRLVPQGAALAHDLAVPPNRSRNAALRVMAAPSVTLGVDRLSATPGLRAKARLVVGWTFPPADFMREWSALARRGRAGLLLAYAWRPLALAGQARAATVAWRQATRVTRGGRA